MGLYDKIKNDIQKSGTNKSKFLYIKEGSKVRVRFLTDMEDGLEIPFHDSYALGVNVPCQEVFGRDCEYCNDSDLRTRNQYVWCVYDYESDEVKLLMAPVNQCSPVPHLAAVYESYGTLTDRDYEIKRQGKGQNTSYSVLPLDKKVFRNKKIKPLSEQSILKIIDKAYPAEDTDYEEEEEEKKPTRKGNKTKPDKTNTKKSKPEPEEEDDDDWGEEETEIEYEDMKPVELYKLCKERGISCKPKKSKEYYIDLLEEYDEENEEEEEEEDEDDWDDEE